jgi:hypothetical protein
VRLSDSRLGLINTGVRERESVCVCVCVCLSMTLERLDQLQLHETFFIRITPDVIFLLLYTARVLVYNSSYTQSIMYTHMYIYIYKNGCMCMFVCMHVPA